MARFSRMEVLTAMVEVGLVPVFYNGDLETAKKIVAACADGGVRCVEFVNRGDLGYEIFSALVKWAAAEKPEVILGAGSVLDGETAALFINSGANFIVGPNLSEAAAVVCNRRMIPYSPGCGSATEIVRAQELGVEIVKVFPGGQVGGPAFIKAVKGPMPWTKAMPTGGVSPTPDNVTAWIEAGAVCLGMGSKLVRKDLVAAGDWAGITKNVADCIALIKKARG